MYRPSAFVMINKDNHPDPDKRMWPGLSVKQGLEKAGFNNRCKYAMVSRTEVMLPWDLLVCWTMWSKTARVRASDDLAKIGGKTLCMENGWIGYIKGIKHYQLAWRVGNGSGINGQGEAPVGDDSRWKSWGIELAPWRKQGKHILVCAQRGMRPDDPDITHGEDWPDKVVAKIRKYTDRPIHFRPHPGNNRPCIPKIHKVEKIINSRQESLEENMKDAWCGVVYSSTAANEMLVQGIPVCYDGVSIMCKNIAGRVKEVDNPPLLDRETEMKKLAWYQWSNAELSSGMAFKHVLEQE